MTTRFDSGIDTRSSSQEFREIEANFLPFILYWLRPYKWLVVVSVLFLLISAAGELGIGKALSGVIDHGFGADGYGGSIDRHFFVLYAVVLIFGVATCIRIFAVSWIGEHVAADIRTRVYRHVIGLSPAFFEGSRTGDLLSRLSNDINLVRNSLTSSASDALKNVFLTLGGVILLTVTSPKLAGIVFLLLPIAVAPIVLIGRRVHRLSRASQSELANVICSADETLRAIQTVHAFTQEEQEQRNFTHQVMQAFRASLKCDFADAVFSGSIVVTTLSLVTAILWVGARDVMGGQMSPGDLTAFVIYSLLLAASISSLSEVWGRFQRAAGASDRLLEILETEPEITVPQLPLPLPVPARGAITFADVTFSYPKRPGTRALQDFNLEIRAGETIALVGPSGAGKSTVFNLILRFYDPQMGRVLFDGVVIRDVDPTALRSRLGLVAQEPVLFGRTIADNIRYGRPEATSNEVRRVAQAAAAAEFIEALPDGYDTRIGDRGVLLSGGQRQRLAIARAILLDAPVILFDEATSSLDSQNEQLVQVALHDVLRERTSIIIAHRLATVVRADRIVVMDGGRIIDIGAHCELLERCELYDHLARLQFTPDRVLRHAILPCKAPNFEAEPKSTLGSIVRSR
ncbi:MAG: ABC transporter transmembrane domain-containing protein [Pirellulales bacterium]